jgi:hypothetical protein
MYHQTETEKKQAETIQFLNAKISELERELKVLRAALTGQTIEAETSYRDNIERFDQLAKQVLEVIIYLVKIWKRPVSYHEILKAFQAKYPNVAKEETVTRLVRKLVEDKWLATPQRGTFIPIPKKSS